MSLGDPRTRLRAAYWIGAAADGLVAVALCSPALLALALRLPTAPARAETRVALYVAAALMAGWTVLLVWGAARPVERRAVLLMTAVPVIAGLALAVAYGQRTGYLAARVAAALWLQQALLSVVMLAAFLAARRTAEGERVDHAARPPSAAHAAH